MTFESPAALALALTVPAIVALWLLRPRRPRRRVPSVMLWPGSPAERMAARPWQRLRNHPLLWLQVAAALLLALAAARPFLPADAAGQQLVVLLDASGSMAAADAAPDRFSTAKAAVLDLARGLGPDQTLTLIRVDAEPRALVVGASDASAVEAALAGEAVGLGPADASAAVELARALVPGPAEWVLVGDGGLDLAGARRPAGTAFRHLRVGEAGGNVAVIALAARAEGDGSAVVATGAASASGRTAPPGSAAAAGAGGQAGGAAAPAPGAAASVYRTVTVQAGIRNAGPAPAAGRLQLLADGQLVGAREWRLEPGAETWLVWPGLPTGSGRFEARLAGVAAEANHLAADDRAWAVVAPPSEAPVLLVGPGSTFLERALAVAGGVRPFRVAVEDWPALAGGAPYPLTVLDRHWPDARPRGSALYVGPPVGPEVAAGSIRPRADHPLLRHVDFSEVRVARARQLPLDASWETVVDSDGGPLLLVRESGGRREALLAFELGQSDLPLRPAFPVLMANLVGWLLPSTEGAPLVVPAGALARVEAVPLAAEAWVEDPGGRVEALAPPWPPRPFRPPSPGLYRVVQSGEGLRAEQPLVAEGYHPAEASVAPRALELPADDGVVAVAQSTLVLWPWLAGLVLALGLVEWWVDARGR